MFVDMRCPVNLSLRWWIWNCSPSYPPPIRYLEKQTFCIWHGPMFSESNKNVPKPTKVVILIAILLGAYSSNGIDGTQTTYASFDNPTTIYCSFQCGWKRELFVSLCLRKHYFFKISRLLPINSTCSVQGNIILSVLIGYWIV